MRRKLLKGLAGLPAVLALNACLAVPSTAMQVAAHVWPGYELIFLAQREGWLDVEQVKLIDTASATESMGALQAGKVDAAALTLNETLTLIDSGVDLRVVLVFDLSAGADVVLGRAEPDSLATIAGQRIGLEHTAVGTLMLHKLLEAAGLAREDVQIVPLTVDQHLEAWRADAIDVLISYEPVSGILIREGAHRLLDSSAFPDIIFDVLAVRAEFLQTRRGRRATEALVSAHFRALMHLQRNPTDAAYRLAPRLGVDGPDALASYRGLILPDVLTNHNLLGASGAVSLAAHQLMPILHEQGQIHTSVARNFTDTRYLPPPERFQ